RKRRHREPRRASGGDYRRARTRSMGRSPLGDLPADGDRMDHGRPADLERSRAASRSRGTPTFNPGRGVLSRRIAGAVGRPSELAVVEGFLDDPVSPRILLVEGDPGIGKTTIWKAAVTAAADRGYRVLSARPAQVETTISFAAVGDLLEPILAQVAPDLPDPQRRALEVALLLSEPDATPPEPRGIAFALLPALRAAATSSPVLVAVDDVQWLDGPSAAALLYSLRRLGDEQLRVLIAQRVGELGQTAIDFDRAVPGERLRRIPLGPLSLGAIQRLVNERLGEGLPRPVLQRLPRA